MLFTSPSYSHCLGARCPHPHNPFGRDRCEACGADLVIADRFRLGERLPCSVRGSATSLTVVMDDQRPQSPRRLLKVLHQWDPRWQIQFRRESRLLTHLSRSPLTRGPSTLLSPSPFPYSSAADLIEFDPMASGISDPMGIVMDCLPGRSLGDVVDASGSLSWGQFQQLFRQLIQLVHYLHRHQIVHGDIKPDNIMI
ncbi:MAG: serine/threonine-protein kinase, partial [Cyanobacteria bacterium P01_H01_bin.130]